MLYHFLPQFAEFHIIFNVFIYLTFRAAGAVVTALILSFILGPVTIRWLTRMKVGQIVRTDGPETHLKKAGTPTMGGILIIMSAGISTLLWADLTNSFTIVALVALLWMGLLGFLDDYLKVVQKKSRGLVAKYKMAGQVAFGLGLGLFLIFWSPWPVPPNWTMVPFFADWVAVFWIPAYLVLSNPTDAGGVAAWGCRLGLPDGVALTSAIPTGAVFDAESALEDFSISLLGSPLPSASAVLLAELQLLAWDPALTEIVVSVRPLADPALSGLATWTPGTPGALPLPMVVAPGVYAAGTIRLQDPTSGGPDLPVPGQTRLLANVPNPFNPQTEIRFEMETAGEALIRIYDVQGRLVRELTTGNYAAGQHAVVRDGSDHHGRAAASGAYYVRLVTSEGVDQRKIMMLK